MEAASKQFRKRNAILACLQNTKQHPSAEMLHEMLKQDHPDISLATVYRNLTLFKEQGTVVSLGTVSGIERFDGDTHPHVHFVCKHCGSVLDLPPLEAAQELCDKAAEILGCEVQSCQMVFTGLCRNCRSENGTH